MFKRLIQRAVLVVLLGLVLSAVICVTIPNYRDLGIKKVLIICIILAAGVILFINRILKYFMEVRYLRAPISKIDKMTGEEFEYYLKIRFEHEGYNVEMTKASQDYGADLVLSRNGETIVIQAKRYDANVGTAAIQEVVASKEYYDADRCMVVTNSHFTINALNLAEANEVELLDRDDLMKNKLNI